MVSSERERKKKQTISKMFSGIIIFGFLNLWYYVSDGTEWNKSDKTFWKMVNGNYFYQSQATHSI